MSREPCRTGWGGWPSNMLTMSIRSMLFRAAYRLSTAAETRDGGTQEDVETERGGETARPLQHNLTGWKTQKASWIKTWGGRNPQPLQISYTHSWPSCPRGSPTGWAAPSSAPAASWDSPHGSYWCHPRWAGAHGPTLCTKMIQRILSKWRKYLYLFTHESVALIHKRHNTRPVKQLRLLAGKQKIISFTGWPPC